MKILLELLSCEGYNIYNKQQRSGSYAVHY